MKQILTIFLLTFISVIAVGQNKVYLNLDESSISYIPKNFYVKNVVDGRASTEGFGTIKDGVIDTEDGISVTLTKLIQNKSKQSEGVVPVLMRLEKFEVTETQKSGKRQFTLDMVISYYTGNNKLIEYSGGAYVQTNGGFGQAIEKLLISNIEGNLKTFDTWMAQNKTTVTAEPSVTVNVSLANTVAKPNHIAYSKSRKLYITDFKDEPDMNSFGAAGTFSGVGMNMSGITKHTQTTIDVTLYVYFDTKQSWMKPEGKNATILDHEQRHFDITAIKGCELKERIQQTTFNPDTYKQQLNDMLNETQEETSELQNLYDDETGHGSIIDKQEEWNKKIDNMLKKQSCY